MVEINASKEANYLHLTILGEIDASSSIHLNERIKEAFADDNKNIIVNCSGLEYISSAGLGVFMSYLQEIEENQIKFVMFGLNEKVEKVFQLLGLQELFIIVATEAEAVKIIDAV